MKHFFKYGAGYINIDSENLFITNTGNWQETFDLKEKNKESIAENNRRIARMNSFVYVLFGIVIFVMLQTVSTDSIYFKFIFILPAIAFFVYRYFKSETGKRYKIPLFKIESVERYDKDGIKIFFLNAVNESDFEIIVNVNHKGFAILSELNLLKPVVF